MRHILKIIVHCSDSDYLHHDNVETIKKWHVEENGWSDIGYHYIITKNGAVHKGRPEEEDGAHARGHNKGSIAICLTGSRKFSIKQFESLRMLIMSDLIPRFKLNTSKVFNHSDIDRKKSCPNFNVHQVLMWEN